MVSQTLQSLRILPKPRELTTRDQKLRLRYLTPFAAAFALLPFALPSDAVSSLPKPKAPEPAIEAKTQLPMDQQLAFFTPLRDNISKHVEDQKTSTPEAEKPKPLEPKTLTIEVGKGQTLAGILQNNGIPGTEAYDIVKEIGTHYDPRKVRAGQELTLNLEPDTETQSTYEFSSLKMPLNALKTVSVSKDGEKIKAELEEKATSLKTHASSTTIRNSIYGSAELAGIPRGIIAEMIRVYSWNVDFQRDIRKGDTIEVLYETHETKDGHVVKSGNLLYANLSVGGRELPMYRFKTNDGMVDYFDPKGQSIKKTLMKTPIDGARLSSGFGMRRHPVLGYNKMHKGVDFAAPTGTPIYAAGDGKITFRGRKGGYGNFIKIRHNSELSTAYAHLSKFRSSVKNGIHVKQGQIIGYVGSTGRSTGPHLHYEVLKNGKHVNPRSVDLPTGTQLKGTQLANFKKSVNSFSQDYAALTEGLKFASQNDGNAVQ